MKLMPKMRLFLVEYHQILMKIKNLQLCLFEISNIFSLKSMEKYSTECLVEANVAAQP
mgnify:CR=1 FL=1